MCGIFGFLEQAGRRGVPGGRADALTMLEALACRGPDSAGVAVIGPPDRARATAPGRCGSRRRRLGAGAGRAVGSMGLRSAPRPRAARRRAAVPLPPGRRRDGRRPRAALGARRGGPEVLSLGTRLDLVKQVGSPDGLEAAYGVSAWCGPLAIGHTRMSTESRIDLSHSQPFWVHGVLDLATVHNGHVTNYHQLRRRYEQKGAIFYTDNDSEVIGVYLRDRLERGRTLPEATGRLDPRPRRRLQLPGRLAPRAWGSSATDSASSR